MTNFDLKKLQILSKIAKIRDGKMLKNPSITTRNYAVTYYQTLVEVGWPLSLEKPKNDKIFKIFESFIKNC